MQIVDQGLLWRATPAGIPLNCSLIDHDGESKAGMGFRLRHDLQGCPIHEIAWSIPVEDDPIDPAADHVIYLICDLGRIGGVVADIHMVRFPEPEHHMGVNFGRITGIEQSVDVSLADVPGAEVTV